MDLGGALALGENQTQSLRSSHRTDRQTDRHETGSPADADLTLI
jgi:hypothetical protein